jgi:hypothetical protein
MDKRKKDKRTRNDIQNITEKTKELTTLVVTGTDCIGSKSN